MAVSVLQIVGLVLGTVGLVLTCAVTGMPQWKVTAFIENNIIVFESQWEGLWMACVRQMNIRMQCKIYDSLLALPSDLQAGRALMCVAVALGALAFAAAVMGMRCTLFIGDDERTKGWILLFSGVVFIMSGLAVLIPVSWTGNAIIRDFYNPLVNSAQKRELGDALFIGWTTALILMAAGVVLCLSCPKRDEGYTYKMPPQAAPYSPHRGTTQKAPSVFSRSQYV